MFGGYLGICPVEVPWVRSFSRSAQFGHGHAAHGGGDPARGHGGEVWVARSRALEGGRVP